MDITDHLVKHAQNVDRTQTSAVLSLGYSFGSQGEL